MSARRRRPGRHRDPGPGPSPRPRREPPDSTEGTLAPARPGKPGGQPRPARLLPAHHGRLLLRAAQRTRRPATSAARQQLSRGAEGPARRDIGPWRALPRHGALTMTRGPKADAEQRDQTRAPRNRDPREAEAGPLVESCPGPARAPAAADVNDGPVTMDAVGPRGHAGLPDLGGQRPEPQASRLRAERTDTRAAMTAEPATICDQQTQRAQAGLSGSAVSGRD